MLTIDVSTQEKNKLQELYNAHFLQLFINGGRFQYSSNLQVDSANDLCLVFQKEKNYLLLQIDFRHTPLFQLQKNEDFLLSINTHNEYPYEIIKKYNSAVETTNVLRKNDMRNIVTKIDLKYEKLIADETSIRYLAEIVIALSSQITITIKMGEQVASFSVILKNDSILV